jgi:hypothetical protein
MSKESVKYIFKATHGLASNASKNFYNKANATRTRTYYCFKLELPSIKSNFLKNTIFYNGVKLWNELPLELRKLVDYNHYLNKLQTF